MQPVALARANEVTTQHKQSTPVNKSSSPYTGSDFGFVSNKGWKTNQIHLVPSIAPINQAI
jgi:hypothetical protein